MEMCRSTVVSIEEAPCIRAISSRALRHVGTTCSRWGRNASRGDTQHCWWWWGNGLQLPAGPTVPQDEPLGPRLLRVVVSPIVTNMGDQRRFPGLRLLVGFPEGRAEQFGVRIPGSCSSSQRLLGLVVPQLPHSFKSSKQDRSGPVRRRGKVDVIKKSLHKPWKRRGRRGPGPSKRDVSEGWDEDGGARGRDPGAGTPVPLLQHPSVLGPQSSSRSQIVELRLPAGCAAN